MNYPKAKVICDSISPEGVRLTTLELKMHRFCLSEMNTHRAISKNSASSRAIPINKQINSVQYDPAFPLFWGKNQKGMSPAEEMNTLEILEAQAEWIEARDNAVESAIILNKQGLHKQLVNRLLEPFMWHTMIISATEWNNFFAQRLSLNPETKQPYAQQEMFYAAKAVYDAYHKSTPNKIYPGQWHLPYINDEEIGLFNIDDLKKISVGRNCRVSYLTHEGIRNPLEDIALCDRLAHAKPMHPSPFEHVATPQRFNASVEWYETVKGNFTGWHQYRHSFPNENITEFDFYNQ